MPEPEDKKEVAIRLDLERQKEIDAVRARFEQFYTESVRHQTDIKHSIETLSRSQDHMKERFEQGTARTLRELKHSWDQFIIEWGEKKVRDEQRDKGIDDNKTNISRIRYFMDKALLVIVGGIIAGIIVFVYTGRIGVGG